MKTHLRLLCCFFMASQWTVFATTEQTGTNQQSGTSATDKTIRVYVTDSQSWEVRGGWGASGGTGGGSTPGGARPQTAEIIKTFGERCPDLTVTSIKDKANYAVILDHEGGKGIVSHHNKIAVFNRAGDSIFSHSTVSLGNSVKDACEAIRKDVQKNPQSLTIPALTPTVAATPTPVSPAPVTTAEEAPGTLLVSSNPDGADIYVDDQFVGNAPANLKLKAGKHAIKVKANGFKDWSRDVTVHAGSEMRLIATLEKTNISAELAAEAKQSVVGGGTETKKVLDESKQKAETTGPPETTEPLAPNQVTAAKSTAETLGIVFLTSEPSGAEVYVDNSLVGKAPVTLNLKPGQHYIRVFMNDYQNWSQLVTVEAGSEAHLTATLKKSN
jgi:hypothetical protein